MRILLVEPEIPQNTGNIARTCVVTGTPLMIAGKMGFEITEKNVRRAGLDYWPDLDLTIYPDLAAVCDAFPQGHFWYFSSHAAHFYHEVSYEPDAVLVFGRETRGLPKQLLEENAERCVRIPMLPQQRCLNLANAVCTGLYEALRQHGFPHFV
ncbi:MAG: tRNA (cytidine(34)-2'-O)-methyltransferase [Clostridia bacterium]|nr:tRNA (cytidine(34)-2'-O)-methyltransferase [Clostridia bacterium]